MNAEQHSLIREFIDHLSLERRLSPHTASNYRRDLTGLAEWCRQQSLQVWDELDSQHIRAFLASRHRQGMAPRSIQRQLSAIRSFYNYLLREQAARNNPANDVRAPKAGKRLPATLDVDRMVQLVSIPADDPLACRDRAILELLYSSGLRLAELVNLDWQDVDRSEGEVRVTGKGNKTRVVPLGRYALEAINHWLKLRSQFAGNEERALFVGNRGQRISPRTVQSRVKYWARRQELDERVYPHLFRHSFASHLLESSGDLRAVQELLGHSSVTTTQIYTHLDFQHLARIYDKAHPRARKKD